MLPSENICITLMAFLLCPTKVLYQITAPGGTWGPEDNGDYTVLLEGEQIADVNSNFMESDTLGTFAISLHPPEIVSAEEAEFTDTIASGYITLYDEDGVAAETLDDQDVRVTGPNGFDQLARFVEFTTISSTQVKALYEITAPGGTWGSEDNGDYTVLLEGGQIADVNGHFMSSEELGTFPVDLPSAPPVPLLFRYDFGTADSPVENGYVQVTPDTEYDPVAGYGWWNPSGLQARDRNDGSDTERDFVFAKHMTFLVDVPNGTYNVSLQTGDYGPYWHDNMLYYLENVLAATDSSGLGHVTSWDPISVEVTDNQLLLDMVNDGHQDPNVLLNAIEIELVELAEPDIIPPTVEFIFDEQMTNTTGSASVVIHDNVAVNPATLDNFNFRVTCAAINYNELARFVSAEPDTAHPSITARYEVLAPGGRWDAADNGTYTVSLEDGQIGDISGNTAPGETLDTFEINLGENPTYKYDFGTASSPVMDGFTRVTDSTAYNTSLGYGWNITNGIRSRDREQETDLYRDFNFMRSGSFLVDIPNGSYTVTVEMGDREYAHDEMSVHYEGLLGGMVSSEIDQYTKVIEYNVEVNDGQLKVDFHDLGGSDPYVVVNAPTIAQTVTGEVDTNPPQIIDIEEGDITNVKAFAYVTYHDDVAVDVGSLDSQDIRVTDPNGGSQLAHFVSVDLSDPDAPRALYEITAPGGTWDSSDSGPYTVSMEPDQVRDVSGNYVPAGILKTIDVDIPEDTSYRFDFGTTDSPVAEEHIQVTESTLYSADQGYGWLDTQYLQSRDRQSGSDSDRDFVFANEGTFLVDLPSGTYDVTLTTGDRGPYFHDEMGFSLEGVPAGGKSTAAQATLTWTISDVLVEDGQLSVNLKDLGGSDPNILLNALEIDLKGLSS